MPTFVVYTTETSAVFATLTTPVNYLKSATAFSGSNTGYPADPFATEWGCTFAYWAVEPGRPVPSGHIVGKETQIGGTGWILISRGPDLDYDIPPEWEVYNPAIPQPSLRLLTGTNKKGESYTYDPTNGTISDGDIWRIRRQ